MKIKMYSKTLIGTLIVAVLLVGIGTVMAHESFTETKKLIDSKVSCDRIANEQLEEIGDYLMEQMHPGEAHEQMHKMMGGEDSETTKLMHINMAKMMYCNNGQGMNNMMDMMSGVMMGGDMMNIRENMMNRDASSGMMNMMGNNLGMMRNYNTSYNTTSILINILLITSIIAVSIWSVKLIWQKK